jgi:hypothetical protein
MSFDWFKASKNAQSSMISFSKQEVIAAGEFLAFKNMPYYEKFISVLQERATKSGLDIITADEALINIGERRAILNMINELRVEEHTAETVLRASLTESAIDLTEPDTNW